MADSSIQQNRRALFVITAPSGGGKSTIVKRLLADNPALGYSLSTTTRPPRPGEEEGKAYNFVSREEFRRLIDAGAFLEWAEVHGNLYGTRLDLVEKILSEGRDVVMDIDVQGAMSLRRKSPEAVLVFLVPPSVDVLEQRLRARAQDSDAVIAGRLRNARGELRAVDRFDYLVLNENLEDAIAEVQAIIAAERCRSTRRSIGGKLAEVVDVEEGPSRGFAPSLVYTSEKVGDLLRRAERVAHSETPVLLLGESGTGKEILAEAIHRAGSRAKGPLVRVNCGAISGTLLESELFGHVAGAFTGAVRDNPGLFRAADTGTIFLDEIGEISPDLQVKLLRVLQEGELRPVGGTETLHVDVRLIAATNRDLDAEVKAGRFREDLFYRLNVVALWIPPLRERREDIPVLVEHFLRNVGAKGYAGRSITPAAMEVLEAFDWPGNVRQLENAIEHAVVLSRNDPVDVEDLPKSIRTARTVRSLSSSSLDGANLQELEVGAIRSALTKTKNNLTHAARELGITRRALTYRLEKFGIEIERKRGRPRGSA